MVGAVCFVGCSPSHSVSGRAVELRAFSFVHRSDVLVISSQQSQKIRRKRMGRLVIVDNLGGQYEDNFEDVQRQMVDFFTYKAVRTVMTQLNEINPTQYRWLYDHVAANNLGYGKKFVRNLGKEKHELAERVMATRLQLYSKWIKKCDHVEMYKRISDQNLDLLRERLKETVIWPPSDDSNIDG